MVRLALLLLVAMSFFNGAHAGFFEDLKAKIAADRAAMIKAGKMPPVRLNEKQMAKLAGAATPKGEVLWVGAGRNKDGKIFVCHVTSEKNVFGKKILHLYSGTFEADGSYQKSHASTFSGADIVLMTCHSHGLVPPVKLKRTTYYSR